MMIRWQLSHRSVTVAILFASICFAQKDPGVSGGPSGAGSPIPGLAQNELALFFEGKLRTTQLEAIAGVPGEVANPVAKVIEKSGRPEKQQQHPDGRTDEGMGDLEQLTTGRHGNEPPAEED